MPAAWCKPHTAELRACIITHVTSACIVSVVSITIAYNRGLHNLGTAGNSPACTMLPVVQLAGVVRASTTCTLHRMPQGRTALQAEQQGKANQQIKEQSKQKQQCMPTTDSRQECASSRPAIVPMPKHAACTNALPQPYNHKSASQPQPSNYICLLAPCLSVCTPACFL